MVHFLEDVVLVHEDVLIDDTFAAVEFLYCSNNASFETACFVDNGIGTDADGFEEFVVIGSSSPGGMLDHVLVGKGWDNA
jgi:hypothetical protein